MRQHDHRRCYVLFWNNSDDEGDDDDSSSISNNLPSAAWASHLAQDIGHLWHFLTVYRTREAAAQLAQARRRARGFTRSFCGLHGPPGVRDPGSRRVRQSDSAPRCAAGPARLRLCGTPPF